MCTQNSYTNWCSVSLQRSNRCFIGLLGDHGVSPSRETTQAGSNSKSWKSLQFTAWWTFAEQHCVVSAASAGKQPAGRCHSADNGEHFDWWRAWKVTLIAFSIFCLKPEERTGLVKCCQSVAKLSRAAEKFRSLCCAPFCANVWTHEFIETSILHAVCRISSVAKYRR